MDQSKLDDLNRELDALEGKLPALRAQYPDEGDFWMAFAGEVEVLEEGAGVFAPHVSHRIDTMLRKLGLEP